MKLFYIKSQSIPGKEYIVRNLGAEGYRCNCANFVFNERQINGLCKHVLEVIKKESQENEAKK